MIPIDASEEGFGGAAGGWYCSSCGFTSSLAPQRFCTECGVRLPDLEAGSRPETSDRERGQDVEVDATDATTPDDVELAFGTDRAAAKAASRRIVETGNTRAMRNCIERALHQSDPVAAEFWYQQTILARHAPSKRLVLTCIEYARNILEKSGRLAEAALVLDAVSHLPFEQTRSIVEAESMRVAHLSQTGRYVRHAYDEAWIEARSGVSVRLLASHEQYLRLIRELHEAAVRHPNSDTARLIDPTADGHLARLMRTVRRLAAAPGADTEALLQALYDWLQAERSGQASWEFARRDAERSCSELVTSTTSTSASPPRREGSVRPLVLGFAAAALALGAILWAVVANPSHRSEAGGPLPMSSLNTPHAPASTRSASQATSGAVTDVCRGPRGDARAGDLVEVRLTHDSTKGRLTARFQLAQPLDVTGDDAALLLILASADNSRSYQAGVEWLDGELAGTWVFDLKNSQETHPADSEVRLKGSTVTIAFPDDIVVDLGPGWQWMASSSIDSTDMDGCPSDEYEFRTFPRK